LALVDALLNNKEAAITEARRAVEMLPVSKDAVDGPGMLINLALAYAWTGELNLAFEILSSLKKTPGEKLFLGQLRFERFFDPLRTDPRFEKANGRGSAAGLSLSSVLSSNIPVLRSNVFDDKYGLPRRSLGGGREERRGRKVSGCARMG
jgi:hypothetical protein